MNPAIEEPSKTPLYIAGGLLLAGNAVRFVANGIVPDILALVLFVAAGGWSIAYWVRRR